jgi:hypothetical protein
MYLGKAVLKIENLVVEHFDLRLSLQNRLALLVGLGLTADGISIAESVQPAIGRLVFVA